MSNAINSLWQLSQQPSVAPVINTEQPQQKSPTFQHANQQPNGQLTDELRKQLLLEQTKTQYIDLMTSTNLPPINTGRRSAPPGFAGFDKNAPPQGHTPKQASTLVFQAPRQN
jgi:hypothetical protein